MPMKRYTFDFTNPNFSKRNGLRESVVGEIVLFEDAEREVNAALEVALAHKEYKVNYEDALKEIQKLEAKVRVRDKLLGMLGEEVVPEGYSVKRVSTDTYIPKEEKDHFKFESLVDQQKEDLVNKLIYGLFEKNLLEVKSQELKDGTLQLTTILFVASQGAE